MALPTATKDGILTIQIPDERLVEPSHLSRLFEDMEAILSKSTKLHKLLDIEKDEAAARKAHQKKGLFR